MVALSVLGALALLHAGTVAAVILVVLAAVVLHNGISGLT